MAMLKNLSTLMTLSVIAITLLPKATFAIGKEPVCSKGMTKDCGSQLFKIVVLASTTAPTKECCRELVKAGKKCNDQFVQLILSAHKQVKASDVHKRSNKTWNNCVAAVKSASAFEPTL